MKIKKLFVNLLDKHFFLMFRDREIPYWRVVLERMIFAIILLILSRWLLYWFNSSVFHGGEGRLFNAFFYGIRFDWFTLTIINIPFLVFIGLPLPFKYNRNYQRFTNFLYIFPNALAIGLNLIDVIYFRFLDKRMTAELLEFINSTDDNQGDMMFHFALDFWYMIVIFLFFVALLIFFARNTTIQKEENVVSRRWFIRHTLGFTLIFGISAIGFRGGLQTVPINIIDAAKYAETRNMPLVLNTPFTIIKGAPEEALERCSIYPEEVIDSIYYPFHSDLKINRFAQHDATNYNVVIIILEGIGQEMIHFYNPEMPESITPFLDSLLSRSLSFDGRANGRRSIETLPSVLCGLPSLMDHDYPTSRYSTNNLDGLGSQLKRKGYETSFFHGGNNGSMNFDATAMMCGFDSYFGRNEYHNEKDYDGCWGIYDGPFLKYFNTKLCETKEPFVTTIFTLSSHHPFSLPSYYSSPLSDDFTPFEKTVRYADDALRDFFFQAEKNPWFKNTIFVITADHVSPEHRYESYNTTQGRFKVPLAFYCEDLFEPAETKEVAQHIDVALSLGALLKINDSTMSFGRNLFDSLTEPAFIGFNNANIIYWNKNPQKENLKDAIFQQYINRMIDNKFVIK